MGLSTSQASAPLAECLALGLPLSPCLSSALAPLVLLSLSLFPSSLIPKINTPAKWAQVCTTTFPSLIRSE